MISLLNVSKVLDNSTIPPTEFSSNPTFTNILPPTSTTNYYRRSRCMCNCCMRYPNCLPNNNCCQNGIVPYQNRMGYNPFSHFGRNNNCCRQCCNCMCSVARCMRNMLCCCCNHNLRNNCNGCRF